MPAIGFARSEEGEPRSEEGEAADRKLAAAAGVRGGEMGNGETGTEPEACVNGADGDFESGSAAGG